MPESSCQSVEKTLQRMRIGDQRRSITRQFRPRFERSSPLATTCPPGLSDRAGPASRTAKSATICVSGTGIVDEMSRAKAATLFATETYKIDRAAWLFAFGKARGELQHGDTT